MHLFWPQTYEADVGICEDVPELLGAHEGHIQCVSTLRHQVPAIRGDALARSGNGSIVS